MLKVLSPNCAIQIKSPSRNSSSLLLSQGRRAGDEGFWERFLR